MNDLMSQSFTDTSHLTPIEIALRVDENGMTTAKRLYEFLELNPSNYSRWAKSNISENQFAEEGVDYWVLVMDDERNSNPNPTQDFKLTARFAKKLSMKGNGEKAEEARDYFTKVEDGAKQMVLRMQEMSPQLQVMINMELEQKRQAKEQERQAAELAEVRENQKTLTQALIKPAEVDFRTWVNNCLSAIAESEGYLYIGNSQERHRVVRTESYERLTRKRPCRLDQRVMQARGKATMAGANQSQINAINKLTVIEADKDLRPVYESVIREMLAAYRVNI
ncbi:antA/AntB antirepressor family protein [Lachnoclostridium pacaense]|uniref:antA/AntB antirepressor family protein n=1 Tax=Enterocloster hominis (ex Hitch et al. 2024) TaxID=1917870 RepID=UPI001D11F9EE|nr:antA/AntB antirepressor family protein [Lachnoclostridium pacaense]MCC2820681.1 antA/AntB antirepressor family protein [Lachnoclostridium pacaense]